MQLHWVAPRAALQQTQSSKKGGMLTELKSRPGGRRGSASTTQLQLRRLSPPQATPAGNQLQLHRLSPPSNHAFR